LARMLFEPAFRALHDDWQPVARRMVGIMHLSFGRTPDDPAGLAVIERLSASSPDFVAWWSDYRLARYEPSKRVIRHPVLGRLNLLFTSFVASAMAQRDDALIFVMQSPLDEATRERLGASAAPQPQRAGAGNSGKTLLPSSRAENAAASIRVDGNASG
jgi:hypothetical protein